MSLYLSFMSRLFLVYVSFMSRLFRFRLVYVSLFLVYVSFMSRLFLVYVSFMSRLFLVYCLVYLGLGKRNELKREKKKIVRGLLAGWSGWLAGLAGWLAGWLCWAGLAGWAGLGWAGMGWLGSGNTQDCPLGNCSGSMDLTLRTIATSIVINANGLNN